LPLKPSQYGLGYKGNNKELVSSRGTAVQL
jgi:hypothetical protein